MKQPTTLLLFQGLYLSSLVILLWILDHQAHAAMPIGVAGAHSLLLILLIALTVYKKSRAARYCLLLFFSASFLNTLPILVTQYHQSHHIPQLTIPFALQVLAIFCLFLPASRQWLRR